MCLDQSFHSLLLHPNIHSIGPVFPIRHCLRLLSDYLLPDHHLDHYGKLLQAALLLLEPVHWGEGYMHRCQHLLPGPGNNQHVQRLYRVAHSDPAHSEAADDESEEGGH